MAISLLALLVNMLALTTVQEVCACNLKSTSEIRSHDSHVSNMQQNNHPNRYSRRIVDLKLDSIFELLYIGNKFNKLHNAEIFIGIYGSQQASLVQVLTRDNEYLESIKDENTNTFFLRDVITGERIIDSQEIYPELFLQPSTKLAIYDCPGFKEDRTVEVDIAVSFFNFQLGQLIDNSKIIFCIDYNSVFPGNPTNRIMQFLKFSTEYLKGLNNFQGSIMLVVTNVENRLDSDGKLVQDKILINEIQVYLKNLKFNHNKSNSTLDEKNDIKKYQKIINIWIQNRITIMREIINNGLVSENYLLQQSKLKILANLQSIKYTSFRISDIGYTPSDQTKDRVRELQQQTYQIAQRLMIKSINFVETNLLRTINSNHNMTKMHNMLINLTVTFKQTEGKLRKAQSATDWIQILKSRFTPAGHNIPLTHVYEISRYDSYYNFFGSVVGKNKSLEKSRPWLSTYRGAVATSNYYNLWYKFIPALLEYFSTTQILIDKVLYNVKDLTYWGKGPPNINGIGIKITKNNFNDFFGKIKKHFDGFGQLTEKRLVPKQLEEVNSILASTIVDTEIYECSDALIVVKANFLFVNITKIKNACCAGSKFKNIRVFAAIQAFVPTIKYTVQGQGLSIVAPKVTLMGDIQLVGTNGADALPNHPSCTKLTKCDLEESRDPFHMIYICYKGKDAAMNKSNDGHQGGTIIILANSIQRLKKHVHIENYGGRGGHGQFGSDCRFLEFWINEFMFDSGKGGNGAPGGWGAEPGFIGIYSSNNVNGINLSSRKGINGNVGLGGSGGWGWNFYGKPIDCKLKKSCRSDFDIYNKPDTYGKIFLKEEANNYTNASTVPAHACCLQLKPLGGVDGDPDLRNWPRSVFSRKEYISTVVMSYTQFIYSHISSINADHLLQILSLFDTHKELKGVNSTIGYIKHLQLLNNATEGKNRKTIFLDFFLSRYKTLNKDLVSYIKSPKHKLQIVSCENCDQFFNKNCLSYKHTIKIDPDDKYKLRLYNFYTAGRTATCSSALKTVRHTIDDSNRRVLAGIKSAILGKVQLMKDRNDNNLIIDILAYLRLTITAVNEFQKNEQIKKDAVRMDEMVKINENYKGEIDSKIEEGLGIIRLNLQPDIDALKLLLDKEIENIIDAIERLKKEGEKKLKELREAEAQLEKNAVFKGICGILSGIGAVASVFVPYGTAAAGIIGAGTGIVETIFIDPIDEGRMKEITEGVGEQSKEMAKLHNSQQYEKTVETIKLLKRLKAYSSDLSERYRNETKEILDQIENYERKANEKVVDYVKMREGLKKISRQIDVIKEKNRKPVLQKRFSKPRFYSMFAHKQHYELHKTEKEKRDKKNIAQMEGIKTSLTMADTGIKHFMGAAKDFKRAKELGGVIGELEKNQEALGNMQDALHESTGPFVKGLVDGFDKFLDGNKSDSSLVLLDLNKYQIKESIQRIRTEMAGYTQVVGGSQIENIANKLDMAMSTVMSIQDKVANYNEQKQHADYMLALNKPEVRGIKFTDPELSKAYYDLESDIKKNSLMWMYERSLETLLQFVFPFAYRYEEYLSAVPDLQGKNISLYIDEIETQLGKIKADLEKEQTEIRNGEDDTKIYESFKEEFNNEPFYKWKSRDFKKEINLLLSGKNVTFVSHIFDSNPKREAIKFNVIDLALKIRGINQTIQQEFQRTLLYFHLAITHSGQSSFRVNDNYYTFAHTSLFIYFSIALNEEKEPRSRNGAYRKLKNGDVTLSPYTMWNFRLVPGTNGNIKMLQKFKKYKIDLVLEGRGIYIKGGSVKPEYEVERFYKPDPVLLALNTNFDELQVEAEGQSFKIQKHGKDFVVKPKSFRTKPKPRLYFKSAIRMGDLLETKRKEKAESEAIKTAIMRSLPNPKFEQNFDWIQNRNFLFKHQLEYTDSCQHMSTSKSVRPKFKIPSKRMTWIWNSFSPTQNGFSMNV